MKLFESVLTVLLVVGASAFAPTSSNKPVVEMETTADVVMSRANFLQAAGLVGASVLIQPGPAFARGRATLDGAYDKYTPRILKGGEFYRSDLKSLIGRGDYAGIKAALQEPPKRTKADKAKADGGIAERAAQAGQFSDSRVLVACDLFAAAFSDSSISEKTKKMKASVEEMRNVILEMQSVASQALGEDTGGGLFGFGGKKLSKSECNNRLKELYIQGGNAYNKYVFTANEDLAVQYKKLPYL